jgi:multicomponent Na+:H+ antiporter subunit C
MTAPDLFIAVAVTLFCLGLFGVVAQQHLLRKIIAVNLMSGGVFLFFVSTAARDAASGPDPVPQAMVLTGVVVSVSATAFALALVRRIHRQTGEVHLENVRPEESEKETSQ